MAAETLTTSRNSNAVEFCLVSTPFGSYRCIRLELDLDGLKMLVDSSTGSLVEPERTSGSWTVVRSGCTWLYLIDSSPWYRGILSTGDTLSGPLHHFSQTSLTLWPPDPRIEGAFRYFQRSYYYAGVVSTLHKNVKKDILLEWVCQEQNRIKLQDVSAHFPPTNAESSIFSGPKSTGRSWAGSWLCSIYLEVTFRGLLRCRIDSSVPNVLLYLLVFS